MVPTDSSKVFTIVHCNTKVNSQFIHSSLQRGHLSLHCIYHVYQCRYSEQLGLVLDLRLYTVLFDQYQYFSAVRFCAYRYAQLTDNWLMLLSPLPNVPVGIILNATL